MDQWKLAAVLGWGVLGGMALGALVFGSTPVSAQRTGFTQCFVGMQEATDINDRGVVQLPHPALTILVPAGWTVVSGGGGDAGAHGYVLFCR